MFEVLYLSLGLPYDGVSHAGGKTLNYYIDGLARIDDIKISVVSFCSENQFKQETLTKKGIDLFPIIRKKTFGNYIGSIASINSKYNPYHKNANIMTSYAEGLLLDELKDLKNNGYTPDVIFLEWTQIVLLVERIKKIYPDAYYIASEVDVAYLGKEREVNEEKKPFVKKYKQIRANNCKRREIDALSICDYVYTQNTKDDKLLEIAGIETNKRGIMVPFYQKSKQRNKRNNNDILFFGFMSRKENYTAAIWFIEEVLPLIKDLPIRFIVIGGNPPEILKKYGDDRVIITGFVKDIDEFFSKSMCFVAPLLLGAGIKVKVLEAMDTGIPTITNQIGIEGIPARSGFDYIHCENKQEYADAIRKIYNRVITEDSLHGREFVNNSFSFEQSLNSYCAKIRSIATTKGSE